MGKGFFNFLFYFKFFFQLNDDEKINEKEDDLELKTIYSKLLVLLGVGETIDGALKKLNSQKGFKFFQLYSTFMLFTQLYSSYK